MRQQKSPHGESIVWAYTVPKRGNDSSGSTGVMTMRQRLQVGCSERVPRLRLGQQL